MKKNIDIGMIIVLTMSATSVTKTASAYANLNGDFENDEYDVLEKVLKDADKSYTELESCDKTAPEVEVADKNKNASVKIKTIEESEKINSGKIITEKVFDNHNNSIVSGGAIENGTVDFKLKFKSPDFKEDFSLENYINTTDINTSGSSVEFNSHKIPFVGFDVSNGDIVIKKSNLSQNGVVVEQNGTDVSVFDGRKIMLFGSSNQYGVEVEDNVSSEIILNGLSISSEKGFFIDYGSKINIKLIDDSLNTIKNLTNNGFISIYGETGALTSREFDGKVSIFGGVIKATEKCERLSDIVIKGGSVDIKTDKTVKYNEYGGEALNCNIINVNGIGSSETVEINMNGDAFITKTDVGGNLYLFLPNRDNNVVIKNKNTAFIAEVKENGDGKYSAEEISEINRVDVEVSQFFNDNEIVDVNFKIRIPENMKYSEDFKIGIQCFESGWLVDDKIDEKNIAEVLSDENGEYYLVSQKGLESGKTYKCRVFSICGDEIHFSDVMEFKTKSVEENKAENSFDELKISGLTKVYNSEEQCIDISSNVNYRVIYYQNGRKMDSMPVDAGKYIAKVIVNDNEHEYFEKNFEFVIEKCSPRVLQLPEVSSVVCGNAISASKFFGGVIEGIDGKLDGDFKWKNENEIVEDSKSYIVDFIPFDKNYSNVEFEAFVEADDEKYIKFVTNLSDGIEISEGKLLILKTEAIVNDGGSVIYQWYKNKKAIDGAVSSILVIDNISDDDRGDYFVIAKSLDGYFAQSNSCFVDIIEDKRQEISFRETTNKRSKGLILSFKEKMEDDTETEAETEMVSSEADFNFYEYEEESKEENKSEEKPKGFFRKLLDIGSAYDEYTEDDSFFAVAGEEESFDENYEDTVIKRITDDLLIDIYGKVSYPDDNTVAATTPYKSSDLGGRKTVFQLNAKGCFIKVDRFKFNGNELSVLTDRDFPLIVGEDKNYPDVKNHWDEDDIDFVSAFNIMPGQGDVFNPNGNVTRGEFIEALFNLAGKPECETKMSFSDVLEDSRFYDAVNWAYELGFINGRSETEFGVNLNVTREQAAVVISKYIERMGFELSIGNNIYSDTYNISEWALEDVNKVGECGIMRDLGYGRFEPKAFCSRAETATFLKKIIQYKIVF